MIETALWIALAVVMYLAGRLDFRRELEDGHFEIKIDGRKMTMTRIRPKPESAGEIK